jgi:aminoglycoside phosphotransferase (APT) family kinase protein
VSTTEDDVAWVEALTESASGALDTPFEATIVHTDYAEGNVVAQRVGEGWRMNGVFDLGGAYVGDGEYDLARCACWYGMVTPSRLRAFVDPYVNARPPRDGFRERMALYIAADRLVFWEYGHRNGVWFNDTDHPCYRAWAEPFVRLADVI